LTNTLTNLVKVPKTWAMKQVNLYEAKTQLSKLVDEAAAGGEIIIAKGGKPMAKLMPLAPANKLGPRKLGQWAQQAEEVEFDTWWRQWKEMDKEIEADFEASIAKPLPGMSEGAKPAYKPAAKNPNRGSARSKTRERTRR
jgi:prevent-host-death family protein